ncbi:glycosyltransferase [Sphingomonas bacterium]|uniref:glycosyltransferase n=1 Tax=Sphingomonas bacterium TaxID=1895847 RepID=UPI0015765681|nr:glycosyltransferase [Sphingomonas bacterium]
MSICIILQDFALGGTERIALRLARAWSAEGRAVTIFCGEAKGPLAGLIEGAAVRIVVAPGRIVRGHGSRLRLGRAAAAFLQGEPHAACFIPGNFHWPAIPPVAGLAGTVRPHIIAQVSAAIRKPQRRGLRDLFYRWRMRRLLRRADTVVTLSEQARREAAALLPGVRVRTIPLPALEDALPPPIAAGGRMIMAAGRLVREKGFQDLITAFARLDDDARLVIAGEGPERARLAALAASLGVADRVVLPGFVQDIRPMLDAARLFVLSSHFEGYAAVVIEALSAGRPVVATECTPATHELLTDDRFGVTVPIGDSIAMAAAIARMLESPPPDPALLADAVERHRIGPVARAYLGLFDAPVR